MRLRLMATMSGFRETASSFVVFLPYVVEFDYARTSSGLNSIKENLGEIEIRMCESVQRARGLMYYKFENCPTFGCKRALEFESMVR